MRTFNRGDRVAIETRPGSMIHGRRGTVTNPDLWHKMGELGLVEVNVDGVGIETLHWSALRLLSLPERVGEIETT